MVMEGFLRERSSYGVKATERPAVSYLVADWNSYSTGCFEELVVAHGNKL